MLPDHSSVLVVASAALAGAAISGFSKAYKSSSASVSCAVLAAAASVVAGFAITASRRGRKALGAAFAQYPRQYIARRGTVTCIDGNIFKPIWSKAPWSEPFVEIRGQNDAPAGTGPTQSQSTRMKMLWDDEFLYVAAIMDVAEGDELIAKFTERNSPIFHTDSDFEVFIDPAGCCHGYKEFEMNAANVVWNLLLNKPYNDGGTEHSGRIAKEGEPYFWEVHAQKSAALITKGKLSHPSKSAQWCCEIAFAHTDTLPNSPEQGPKPKAGALWRINFSRVENKGAVNWVWSPQIVWTPSEGRYVGQVNMHLPDAWGYLLFADEDARLPDGTSADGFRDPAWPAKHAASSLYYACRAFCDSHDGRSPRSFPELVGYDGGSLVQGIPLDAMSVTVKAPDADPANPGLFTVEVTQADGRTARINQHRLLTMV
eukprot:TRINITY_DN61348_c0_g1_i1.p1 TRINITY_DN61348_c0_g1~~TRINITY_DN61348_c0_g1_i1.p1  ORF type:complete len:428 (-),score=57.87 TRINITY_DN61348_c0_g1_i1:93-1376(-)